MRRNSIKRRRRSQISQEQEPPLLTMHFSTMLKKMKAQNRKQFKINTEEDEDFFEKEVEKNINSREAKLENEKHLITLYDSNFSSVFKSLKKEYNLKDDRKYGESHKDLTLKNNRFGFSQPKIIKYGFEQFNRTSYVNKNCMKEFYDKYSQYNNLTRKHPIETYTPSWAFIKSTKDEKIIPNPLGLVKRSGDERVLGINNHKVGDNYMSALSNSLRYSEHLTTLEFGGNRLSSSGVSNLFKSLNENKELAYKLRTIDLRENHIGKNEIENLINFLQDPKCNLEDLNLYGNLLGDDNVINICDSLAKFVEYRLNSLNLGKNNIHDICCDKIVEMFHKCSGLRVFIINHNWLHNPGVTKIIKELCSHYELRILDLSWNCIGDDLTSTPQYEAIVNKELNHPERLFNNYALDETLTTLKLNLRRNPLLPPIDSLGPKKKPDSKKKKQDKFVVAVKEPKKIPVKPRDPSPFAVILGEYFSKTQLSLVHLDISHNNINYEDSKLISETSKANHGILGMHVDGNAMEIDCLGFITPIEKELKQKNYFSESQIYYGINKEYELRKTAVDTVRKIRGKNNCWICEGFREIKFEYIPEEPITDPNNHLVKLHLDFDNYKPFDMICNGDTFQIVRMCPPGEVHYFFSVDSIPVKTQSKSGKNEFDKIPIESDYIKYTFEPDYMEELNNIRAKLLYSQKKEGENPEEKKDDQKNTNENDNNKDNKDAKDNKNIVQNVEQKTENILTNLPKDKISIIVDTISKVHVKVNQNVVNENYMKTILFSEPRPAKIIDKFVKPRTPWSFPKSIWAYYGYEYEGISEDYLDDCFEFDFNRCQFNKDFKDEESYKELRKMLRERYRDIIDCYKYYSSLSGYQLWQITQNNLTEFINRCPGMCDIKYDINNIFLTQKTVCANLIDKEDKKKNNKNLSENIVRHQFMNLLVKSAKDKYVTVLKQTKDVLEATKWAFERHYDPAIKGFEYHKWRKERYYNEPVDNFLKAFLPILDGVYLSVSRQKGPRKKDVWMVLDEFNNFVQSIVDINEYPIRDNPLIFNQSIDLQVNEIYTDKHINMFLPEFLEALCRAVDKASPIPPGDSKDEWPKEKRDAQPLVKKLENILPMLIKLITHPDLKVLKEKFPMPPKDLVTGLYTPNYDSPFYKDYIIIPGQGVKKPVKTKKQKIVAVDTKDLPNAPKPEEEGKEKEENQNEENKENIENENGEEEEKNKGEEIDGNKNDNEGKEKEINENEVEDKEGENNKGENNENDETKNREINEGVTKEETTETHPIENAENTQ